MKNSKLIRLFFSLKSSELRELHKFVRSPFHNQRKDVILLFDALRQIQPSKVGEKQLFKMVFPNASFDKTKLAHTMNYLMKVIESYWAVQQLLEDQVKKEQYIAKAALAHGQSSIFQHKLKKVKQRLVKKEIENLSFWQTQYEVNMDLYNLNRTKTRDPLLDLSQPTKQLDIFVIGSKLRQACILLAHQNVSKINYNHELLEILIQYLEQEEHNTLLQVPVIALYYYSYKTLKEEQEVYFQQLKDLLDQYHQIFTANELKDFYNILLNFSIKQNNIGNAPYLRICFELYKKALANEVLFENGLLSPFNYKNIALLGIGLQEYDWVKQFSEEYKLYLEPQIRMTSYQYNLAYLQYKKKEYTEALQLLQKVKFDDSLPNLSSRVLLLKIYYELDEKEVLDSYLNSFERMIRRQKTPGYHKNIFLNLVSITRKLIRINPSETKAYQGLSTEISNKKILAERSWLLEQIRKKVSFTKY